MLQNKTGFTLIELLIVMAIIGILASVILISMAENGKKAKVASVSTSMRTAMTALASCLEEGNSVNGPNLSGGNQLCPIGNPAALWPVLQWNWVYVVGGNYSSNCDFQINPQDGGSNMRCICLEQACRQL